MSANCPLFLFSSQPRKAGSERAYEISRSPCVPKSTYVFDRFMVVSEVFAPDDGSPVQMTNDWAPSVYLDAQDFRDAYFQVMKPTHYTLWKLSAARR